MGAYERSAEKRKRRRIADTGTGKTGIGSARMSSQPYSAKNPVSICGLLRDYAATRGTAQSGYKEMSQAPRGQLVPPGGRDVDPLRKMRKRARPARRRHANNPVVPGTRNSKGGRKHRRAGRTPLTCIVPAWKERPRLLGCLIAASPMPTATPRPSDGPGRASKLKTASGPGRPSLPIS